MKPSQKLATNKPACLAHKISPTTVISRLSTQLDLEVALRTYAGGAYLCGRCVLNSFVSQYAVMRVNITVYSTAQTHYVKNFFVLSIIVLLVFSNSFSLHIINNLLSSLRSFCFACSLLHSMRLRTLQFCCSHHVK